MTQWMLQPVVCAKDGNDFLRPRAESGSPCEAWSRDVQTDRDRNTDVEKFFKSFQTSKTSMAKSFQKVVFQKVVFQKEFFSNRDLLS